MALASYALTSLASLQAYMRTQAPMDADLLSIYHDESDSATAATVNVKASTIVLEIVGGTNAGTQTLPFSSDPTITEMVAAINDLDEGWVATVLGSGGEASTGLNPQSATTGFGQANEQFLRGSDTFMQEQAINGSTDQIERYCGRRFKSTTYKHRFNGTGTARLLLRQRPVTEVKRVAIGFAEAMTIRNTAIGARYATVSNDGTNLNLVVDSRTPDTVAIGSNTIAELVAAVIANGSNWTATVTSTTTGAWPATELVKHEHLLALDQPLSLIVPDWYQDDYTLDASTGILTRALHAGSFSGFGGGFWHGGVFDRDSTMPNARHNPGAHIGGHWPRGNFNVFVNYTAGEVTIPSDLEQTANKLAANLIRGGSHDGNLVGQSSPEFSESYSREGVFTEEIRRDLSRHRALRVPQFMDA